MGPSTETSTRAARARSAAAARWSAANGSRRRRSRRGVEPARPLHRCAIGCWPGMGGGNKAPWHSRRTGSAVLASALLFSIISLLRAPAAAPAAMAAARAISGDGKHQPPSVYWVTNPVLPGDTVMVAGAGLQGARVQLAGSGPSCVSGAAAPPSALHTQCLRLTGKYSTHSIYGRAYLRLAFRSQGRRQRQPPGRSRPRSCSRPVAARRAMCPSRPPTRRRRCECAGGLSASS